MEDRTLVNNILKGDMGAFKILIAQHERLVSHMVSRLIDNNEDREELGQDIFIKVYNNLNSFNFESKLSTWVATIAYRMSVSFLKKKNRKQKEDELDQVAFRIGEEEHHLEKKDFARFVHTLIDQLPANYRSVLTLYHLDGFNYEEIGEITGMPDGTVKNYLFRARNKLKEVAMPYIGNEIEEL